MSGATRGDILIIIESPNKREKVAKFSGGALVKATIGHFLDLSPTEMSIDFTTYDPIFCPTDSGKRVKKELLDISKGKTVYVATDPDREGYAIGYHCWTLIKKIAKTIYRAEFHEITEAEVKKGIAAAVLFEKTNLNMYEAFVARRVADRLVGYLLSPYASNILKCKASVGRVQTPCLNLIVEREKEIQAFTLLSEEEKSYFVIEAELNVGDEVFKTSLKEQFKTLEEANKKIEEIRLELKKSGGKAICAEKETKIQEKNPLRPYKTSTMMRAASASLGLGSEQAQKYAQNLFEKGLITYIRTDAENLSAEFLDEAESFMKKHKEWSKVHKKVAFKAGAASQAEAHEAIRPTHIHHWEECESKCQAEGITDHDCIELYKLIFANTLCTQMVPAKYEVVKAVFDIGGALFTAKGERLLDPGYLPHFPYGRTAGDSILPPFNKGDKLDIEKIDAIKKQKSAPSRYTESTLIETLEKKGIGRPSTYATFVKLLLNKGYIEVVKSKKSKKADGELVPKPLAFRLIDEALANPSVAWVKNPEFTKEMEEYLDKIVEGKATRYDFLLMLHKKINGGAIPAARGSGSSAGFSTMPPTEKQISYAEGIARRLGIEPPEGYKESRVIINLFIQENQAKDSSEGDSSGRSSGGGGAKQTTQPTFKSGGKSYDNKNTFKKGKK